MRIRLCLALVLLGAFSVNAQAQVSMSQLTESETAKLFESISITIDGRQTPQLVPLNVKMMHFFIQFDAGPEALGKALGLSHKDLAVLKTGRKDRDPWMRSHEQWMDRRFVAICRGFTGEKPLQLASQLDELDQSNVDRMDSYYKAVLKKLSPDGEQRVRKYVEENIHPVMVTASNSALANANPEFFMQDVQSRCEESIHPLDMPKAKGTAAEAETLNSEPTPGTITTIVPPVE
jgi:hypothetical protein